MSNRKPGKTERSTPSSESFKTAVAKLREKVEQGEVSTAELTQAAALFRALLGNQSPLVDATWRLSQLAKAYEVGIMTVEEYQDKLEVLLKELHL